MPACLFPALMTMDQASETRPQLNAFTRVAWIMVSLHSNQTATKTEARYSYLLPWKGKISLLLLVRKRKIIRPKSPLECP